MISRREFLKIISVAGFLPAFPVVTPEYGRILTKTVTDQGKILLPDSVHQIYATYRGQVQLSSGDIPEIAIQPMLLVHHHPIEKFPSLVEVIAPYAAVRSWCAADAPLKVRLGHGSVLRVIRALDQWLEIENGGWVQKSQLQLALLPEKVPFSKAVIRENDLTFYEKNREIMKFPIARPDDLPRGTYTIREFSPEKTWGMKTDQGIMLRGVTTHNHFNRRGTTEIELPLIAAKLLSGMFSLNNVRFEVES